MISDLSKEINRTGDAKAKDKNPSLLVCVTNFELSDEADKIKYELERVREGKYDLVLIDSSSSKKPRLADETIPNEFYTGLWNRSASMAIEGGYDSLLFVASDVQIGDYRRFSDLVVEASKDRAVGVYTPSLKEGSRCAYEQCLNRNASSTRDCEWVEGFCFLAKTNVLERMHPIHDNKYGWQIDTATCAVARSMGYRVVVDDRVEIFHPHSQKRIDRKEAIAMGRAYHDKVVKGLVSPCVAEEKPKKTIKNAVALVVGAKMDDYLSVTMENNRPMFDRYYVLTSPDDNATQSLCKRLDADMLTYDKLFGIPGCSFNKSGGVRAAQELIHNRHRAKWVILMDADVLLPPEIVEVDTDNMKKTPLYGMKRLDAHTYEDYKAANFREYPSKFAGYFQMYHDKSKLYDRVSRDASESDIIFRDRFPRRILIEDMSLIHIGVRSSHWHGRKPARLNWG